MRSHSALAMVVLKNMRNTCRFRYSSLPPTVKWSYCNSTEAWKAKFLPKITLMK